LDVKIYQLKIERIENFMSLTYFIDGNSKLTKEYSKVLLTIPYYNDTTLDNISFNSLFSYLVGKENIDLPKNFYNIVLATFDQEKINLLKPLGDFEIKYINYYSKNVNLFNFEIKFTFNNSTDELLYILRN
jgi:hypothetical protein